MTPETLRELVSKGPTASLVAALEPLEESLRRKLSKTASDLLRALWKQGPQSNSGIFFGPNRSAELLRAELAVLGCCEAGKVKRVDINYQTDPTPYIAVLVARKPGWLDGWIGHKLAVKYPDPQLWALVRACMHAGVASRPESASYYRLMAYGVNWQLHKATHTPLSQRLLGDPTLLQHEVWRLFEIESRAFSNDHYGAYNARPDNYETWSQALIRLAKEGHVDRAHLVDAALGSLTSGLKPQTLGDFVRFAEALDVTLDELKSREETLRQIAGNATGTVVSFGLSGLARLEAGMVLDRPLALDALEPALRFPKKAQAGLALSLVKSIAKRDTSARPAALRSAAGVLGHPDPTLQQSALAIIESHIESIDEDLRVALRASLDSIAPTLRDRLVALTGPLQGQPLKSVSDLGERIRVLPAYLSRQWGLGVGESAKARWDRVLPEERNYRALAPLQTVDALLEAVALAVEGISNPDDVELILDGIARFSACPPNSEVARTICDRFLSPSSSGGLSSSMGLPPIVRAVVGAWLGVTMEFPAEYADIDGWWAVRFDRHLDAVRRRTSWQPLSSPTHGGGWIDPRTWVQRMRDGSKAINETDAIQSLLRLAPFGRADALVGATALEGRWRRIAIHALGGDEQPGFSDFFHRPLWLAAARARQPRGALDSSVVLAGYGDIPDAVRESRFSLSPYDAQRQTYQDHSPDVTFLPLDKDFDGDVRNSARYIPQCALYPRKTEKKFYLGWMTPWVIEWKSYTWPENLRGFMYWGINRMLQRFDSSSSSYEPNYIVIEALKPLYRRLGDIEHLALAIACMSAEQETRRSATEVIRLAGLEGRFEPSLFSQALRLLYDMNWRSMIRLASTLQPAAKDSPQASRGIVEAVSAFLISLANLPQGSHGLLELIYQESFRVGVGVAKALVPVLEDQQGKSKTGQLCGSLLALQPDESRAVDASAEALRCRLERAESAL